MRQADELQRIASIETNCTKAPMAQLTGMSEARVTLNRDVVFIGARAAAVVLTVRPQMVRSRRELRHAEKVLNATMTTTRPMVMRPLY